MSFLGTFQEFEPKTKFRFAMQIGGSNDALHPIPYYLCKAVTLPTVNHNLIELKGINAKTYVKGLTEWEPITITLYDQIPYLYKDEDAHSLLYDWVMNHMNEFLETKYAYEPDVGYKIDFSIYTLDPGGAIAGSRLKETGTELTVVDKWEIRGAMIESVNFGDLDWSSDELREIELTVRFDYAKYENVDETGFSSSPDGIPMEGRPTWDTGPERGTGRTGTTGTYRDYSSLDKQGHENPVEGPPPRGIFSPESAGLIAAYQARRMGSQFGF